MVCVGRRLRLGYRGMERNILLSMRIKLDFVIGTGDTMGVYKCMLKGSTTVTSSKCKFNNI